MTSFRAFFLAGILCAVLAACGDNTPNAFRITDSLIVNGPGLNGSVQADNRRVYALRGIVADNNYTIRTYIAPGGTLSGDIYLSQQDYLDSKPTFSLVSTPTPSTLFYEKNFTATTSGDYYIALSGSPSPSNPIEFLYFYDLRLLSSSVTTSFATAPTTTVFAGNTASITAGYVHLYSGATVSPSGTYTVTLTSNSTTTLGNPQMFIYADSSLSIGSLLYSSYTTSMKYMIYTVATDTTSESDFNEMPGIAFSAAGPYILIKGNLSIDYTLTIH